MNAAKMLAVVVQRVPTLKAQQNYALFCHSPPPQLPLNLGQFMLMSTQGNRGT